MTTGMSPKVFSICVLLCLIDPRVWKIRNEASCCPGLFSRTSRFGRVAGFSPGAAARHRGQTRAHTDFGLPFVVLGFFEIGRLLESKSEIRHPTSLLCP